MYVVTGWILLQLGDVVIEPLGLPSWMQAALIVGVTAGFPVVLVLSWLFDLTWGGVVRDRGPEQPEPPAHGPSVDSRRLAVLPFVDMSEKQTDAYLGDGLAEEILHALAAVPELDVIARASSFRFRGLDVDLEELAQQLGVSHVLSGSVRRGGDRLRVKAELVEIATLSNVWSESYQRGVEDLFELQAELAEHVASTLVGVLGLVRTRRFELEPKAYDEFLLAVAEMRSADFPSAIEHAERSVAADPRNPRAHGLLAQAYLSWPRYGYATGTDELTRARTHANEALRLDPEFAPARVVRGMVGLYLERDFAQAYFEVSSVEARQPDDLEFLPTLYAYGNRFEEAVEIERRITLRDPLNVPTLISLARKLNWLGRKGEAHDVYDRVRKIQPFHILMIQDEIELALRDGRPDDAAGILDAAAKALLGDGGSNTPDWLPVEATLTWIGAKIEAARGNLEQAHAMAVELESDETVNPTIKIECYLTALDLDSAFRLCDVGIRQFDLGLYDVAHPYVVRAPEDEAWTRFRDDPRYEELLVRLGIDAKSLAAVEWLRPSDFLR